MSFNVFKTSFIKIKLYLLALTIIFPYFPILKKPCESYSQALDTSRVNTSVILIPNFIFGRIQLKIG